MRGARFCIFSWIELPLLTVHSSTLTPATPADDAEMALTLPLAAATLRIPSVPIQPTGQLPMLLLGDGLSWNRPSNYTLWYELAGKNAGIDSAWDLSLIHI